MASLVEIGQRVFTSLGAFPERRLHNRARAIWEASRLGNAIPRYENFDFRRMADVTEHGFLIETGADRVPLVTCAGDIILEEAGQPTLPISVGALSQTSLLGQFASRWQAAVEECAPVASEYEFTTKYGYRVLCRGVLLPFSTDGQSIDRVYGVISWTSRLAKEGRSTALNTGEQEVHP